MATSAPQEGQSSHVFISYSAADRDRVLKIADTLQQQGHKVWIDKFQIAGGADYTREIAHAIAGCAALVVCLSATALASVNVKKELNLAWKRKKPVIPLTLEPVEIPIDFEYNLEAVQRIDAFNCQEADWLAAALEALSRCCTAQAVHGAAQPHAAGTVAPAVRSAPRALPNLSHISPYMINRLAQERQLRQALTDHVNAAPQRPLVLISHGRAEQAVHEYLERFKTHSLPQALRMVRMRNEVKWHDMAWVSPSTKPENALRQLADDICFAHDTPSASWVDSVVKNANRLGVACVYSYRLRIEDRRLDTCRLLQQWLAQWQQVPNLGHGRIVLVSIAVENCAEQASGLLRAFRFAAPQNLEDKLSGLKADLDSHVSIELLPELGNVKFSDIEHWILNVVKHADPPAVIRLARSLLSPAMSVEAGVPMTAVLPIISELVNRMCQECA